MCILHNIGVGPPLQNVVQLYSSLLQNFESFFKRDIKSLLINAFVHLVKLKFKE